MPQISAINDLITLINVFTVNPKNQDKLVELLSNATETSVRHAMGFVSASLHRSMDGSKVIMYAQWQSMEEYQAMRQNSTAIPILSEALKIASFEPGIYEVVRIFVPDAELR